MSNHKSRQPRLSTEELRTREFWTPTQCARVLGRGADYWRQAYEGGNVEGYDDGGRRYLNAASARAHLLARCSARSMSGVLRGSDAEQMVLARFRARCAGGVAVEVQGLS
jgi:hypothetical protein